MSRAGLDGWLHTHTHTQKQRCGFGPTHSFTPAKYSPRAHSPPPPPRFVIVQSQTVVVVFDFDANLQFIFMAWYVVRIGGVSPSAIRSTHFFSICYPGTLLTRIFWTTWISRQTDAPKRLSLGSVGSTAFTTCRYVRDVVSLRGFSCNITVSSALSVPLSATEAERARLTS